MAERQQGVLRRRGGAVGQRHDVVVRHELRDAFCRNVTGVHLDTAREARVGGQVADRAPGIPPQLAGDGEAQVGHVAQRVDEQVDALVVAHDAEREQARRAGVVGARQRGAAGQVGWEGELAHVLRAELGREPGLLVGVHDDGVDAAQERLHQLPVAGVPLVRQHVVRDEHAARAVTGGGGAPDAGRTQQREVRGHDGRDDVHDDDDVDVAQPAPGAHPGVGARPRQHPQAAGKGLDVGRPAGHRLLAGVQRRGVEMAPRHERDVVPGIGQLVRQRRGVRGDAALVGVGGPDQRDLERGAVRHRLSTSPRGRRAARGWRS